MSQVSTGIHDNVVELAIYDLSHGMARNLSAQFLGPDFAIDIIPHTAIIVFGKEYFFGGGIQQADPNVFRQTMGIYPIRVERLGRTTVSQIEFERWCHECIVSGRWNAEAYDLLHKNCNNFSHDAAISGLKLSRGVPDWILNVPQRFLSSPMGQMIRPMLENMQVGGGGGVGVGVGNAPFANMPSSSMGGSVAPMSTPPVPATIDSSTVTNMSSNNNPWANIPQKTSNSDADTTTNTSTTTTTTTTKTMSTETPLLDSFSKPFISGDVKTVSLCVKKINEKLPDEGNQATLIEMGNTLVSGGKPGKKCIENVCCILLDFMDNDGAVSTVVAFILMLLRIMVLDSSLWSSSQQQQQQQQQSESSSLVKCMERLHCALTAASNSDSSSGNQTLLLQSTASRSMAWVTMSNIAATTTSTTTSPFFTFFSASSLEALVDAAMTDLTKESQPRVEIRQAAAAFLYNFTLQQQQKDASVDGLHDLTVSMLCGSMDTIVAETDPTTRLRRLLIAARTVKPTVNNDTTASFNVSAKQLLVDLGCIDAIDEIIAENTTTSTNDAVKTYKKLASELKNLLLL